MGIEPDEAHFNTKLDTIYLGPKDDEDDITNGMTMNVFRSLACPALKNLKYLACDEYELDVQLNRVIHRLAWTFLPEEHWDYVRIPPNLREFAVVINDFGVTHPRPIPGTIRVRHADPAKISDRFDRLNSDPNEWLYLFLGLPYTPKIIERGLFFRQRAAFISRNGEAIQGTWFQWTMNSFWFFFHPQNTNIEMVHNK